MVTGKKGGCNIYIFRKFTLSSFWAIKREHRYPVESFGKIRYFVSEKRLAHSERERVGKKDELHSMRIVHLDLFY